MGAHPPFLNAGNAGPFTLDGTRSFRIGRREAVVLDPGPDVEDHVRALASWLSDARRVRVVVTHGHADHAGGARRLADALDAAVAGPAGVDGVDEPLADGSRLETDEGVLVAVDTPGHARRHLCFHWVERGALFAGDLMLGVGDTTWVGEYPGCVADYLASLRRVRSLAPRVIYPAHGPPLEDPGAALDRYEAHRRDRIRQVEEALRARPAATTEELLVAVYGTELPWAVRRAAEMSLEALAEYVRESGRG
ncbi:MAG: MBL fold metallo-hydrolase [Gemmatimonadota bacterium]